MKRFEDKVVIITGGAGAIGSVTVEAFLKEGAKVVVSDISKQGQSIATDFQSKGFDCTYIRTDITKHEEVKSLIQQTVEKYGKLDIVFTAVAAVCDDPCDELSIEAWEQLININLSGTFFTNKYAIQQMLKQGTGGSIINSGSVYSIVGLKDSTGYSAAMGGIKMMVRSIAATYASKNIRINTVCPGAIKTPTLGAITGKTEAELIKDYPIGRLGEPDEVAKCVLFLASDKASFVSGTELVIDGAYKTK